MEINNLIESLTPLERKVLPTLKTNKDINSIIKATNLTYVEVVRALQWLENKQIIKTKKELKEQINLDKNGKIYLKQGLPETRFLKLLPNTLEEIKKHLLKDEVQASIGLLKSKNLIKLNKKITITDQGKKYLQKDSLEFLKSLPLYVKDLKPEQKHAYEQLKKRRNIIKTNLKKDISILLTDLGSNLLKQNLKINLLETVTPEMLKTSSWKNKKFRRYDIKINVPKISPGRRHFINEVIKYIRKVWLEMGFGEMKGDIIQSSFWDFDALFVPQDHPAREMQDTFFVKSKSYLPPFYKRIKQIHEKSWKYNWKEELAKKNVLRTHTTPLSAQTILKLKKSDLPAKFFSIGKVFRNESLDWSHLFEFNQVEGIVVGENVNFTHLKGYLKEFFKKLGYDKIRIRPAYFPYTEPSAEVEVYLPDKNKWIELGGSGIFRPEMMEGLNLNVPVLAWGLGLGRIISEYYNIKDIRELYKNDLKQLKEIKTWLK